MENLNFNQLRILNPRPQGPGTERLSKILTAFGATIIDCPCMEIIPISPSAPPIDADKTALFIFVSQNAVHHAQEQLRPWMESNSTQLAAIGEQTAKSLQLLGHQSVITAPYANSESMLQAINDLQPTNIVLIKGQGGRLWLENQLQKRPSKLYIHEVYKRASPKQLTKRLKIAIGSTDVNRVIASSVEVAINLIQAAHQEPWWPAIKKARWIAMSSRVADSLKPLDINDIVIAKQGNLFQAIQNSMTD